MLWITFVLKRARQGTQGEGRFDQRDPELDDNGGNGSPRETFQLIRGDFRNKGEKVTADTPAFLPAIKKVTVENKDGRLRFVARESDLSNAPSSERAAAKLTGRGRIVRRGPGENPEGADSSAATAVATAVAKPSIQTPAD